MTSHPLHRVLYVEDEPDIQAIAKIALETIGGFNIKLCGSGKEALESASQYNPDIILLDVMMPGMDGPSTLKALREISELKLVPVIFMTAKVQAHEINQYLALGAADVIAKPFDPMTLADKVRSIWDKIKGN